MSLDRLIARFIVAGRLTVWDAQGRRHTYGDGVGEEVVLRLTRGVVGFIAANPELRFGEAYVEGRVIVEQGDIYQFLEIVARNAELHARGDRNPSWVRRAHKATLGAWRQWNDRPASRRNVAHHYDLSAEFYRQFLDADMQYSCAYFADPDATLEEAQAAKKAHIATKLKLSRGDRVLDLGCGWGGLGLTLAQEWGAEVLGVTLSREQLALARQRAQARGLADRARFELCDYRDVQGPFDRVVSVGMFEHVGRPNYQAYFDAIARLLNDDGVALVHSIGRHQPPSLTNAWTAKYIFPGGYIPSLSEVLPHIERAGLWLTDVEVLRLHYAETLKAWRSRFEAHRLQIVELYDERFCRMWEYYLATSETAFRYYGFMNFQLQLTKRVDALPVTRDYIHDGRRLAEIAQAREPGMRLQA